jgi:NADP-dependent 3-hydroxy acid dehydrogenase YdfG
MHLLITGASKGIGLAIAEKFASQANDPAYELQISICARSNSEIDKARLELEQGFPRLRVFATTCDVSIEAQVKEFAREAEQQFGPVDLLVNNAGFGIFRSIEAMTIDEFDSVLATNLRGVFLMTQAVLPRMISRRSGTIVTISSLAGKNGFAGGAAYCAAKFGVRGLMQSLFFDVREHDIRVVTIFPGSVDTDFFSEASGAGELKSRKALQPEDVAECVLLAHSLSARADISELDLRPTNPKG